MMRPLEMIEIRELKSVDLSNAVLVEGFPGIGFVSNLVAEYLIHALKMEEIGVMDSPAFPAAAFIRDGTPDYLVRIYAGRLGRTYENLVIFVSDIRFRDPILKAIGTSLIDWCKEKGIDTVISTEGVRPLPNVPKISYVASTQRMKEFMKALNIPELNMAVITGLTAILLTQGRVRNLDVAALLITAHPEYPDAKAAAELVQVLADLLEVKVDVSPLIKQAEEIEKMLKSAKVEKISGEREMEERLYR